MSIKAIQWLAAGWVDLVGMNYQPALVLAISCTSVGAWHGLLAHTEVRDQNFIDHKVEQLNLYFFFLVNNALHVGLKSVLGKLRQVVTDLK